MHSSSNRNTCCLAEKARAFIITEKHRDLPLILRCVRLQKGSLQKAAVSEVDVQTQSRVATSCFEMVTRSQNLKSLWLRLSRKTMQPSKLMRASQRFTNNKMVESFTNSACMAPKRRWAWHFRNSTTVMQFTSSTADDIDAQGHTWPPLVAMPSANRDINKTVTNVRAAVEGWQGNSKTQHSYK